MAETFATSAPSGHHPGWWRWLALGISGLLLTVYFHSPVREAMGTSLDSSNYASYAYFTAHGFQYGTEVVPMAGPYGFVLYGWVYSGNLFGARLVLELGLAAALAVLSLWFFGCNRGSWLRWVWLAAHISFTPFIEDLPLEWMLLLGGWFLLQAPPRPGVPWTALFTAALLAFLSLIKGTQLALGLATLGVVLGGHAWLRRWRHGAVIAGAYLGALLLFWVLAGQNILHLPAYVRGMFELAGGYNDAMSLDEPRALFLRGAAVTLLLLAGVGWALWSRRREPLAIASLLLLAGHGFVQWKHAFVRADGHAYILFHFAMVAAPALWLVAWHRPASPARRGTASIGFGLLVLTLAASCLGSGESMLPNWRHAPSAAMRRFSDHVQALRDLPALRARFDHELAAQRQLHALPLTRQAAGSRPIDLFGFAHGLLPLNGLNYRPRPMGGGSFNVFTPALMRLNGDYLRDPARRPDFYLVKLETIDERLLAQDDGQALLALINGYQPLLVEHEHVLMQADPAVRSPEPHLIGRQTFEIGEVVPVPVIAPGQMLVVRFNARPSLLGRLRAALYKLPRLRISLAAEGLVEPTARRLIPAMASSPFLLSPVLENNRDLLSLYTAQPGKVPASFRLSTADRTWFNRRVEVEFFTLPRPAAPAATDVAELLPFADSNLETVHTVDARSGAAVTAMGMLVHPPGRYSWALAGTERTVSLGYGMLPAAYDGHPTDGVGFEFTLLRPGQPPLGLLRRQLDPVARATDRGHQAVEIPLPPLPAGSRLVLTTNVGGHGDGAYDWCYVSNLAFQHGGYLPAQFPGFKVLPVKVDAPAAAIFEDGGEKVLMTPPASALTFLLTGQEQELNFEFGLLPGTYREGGRTEGVIYRVELIQRGQPAQELFQRWLQPVTQTGDQGRQHATVRLPVIQAGDHIVVRTSTPPSGNTAWAWAYLTGLHFE